MQLFLTFAFLFYLGSTIGWVLELFFRRFVSAKKWINPGFLTGPYLPLYGFGLCLLFLLAHVDFPMIGNIVVRKGLQILLMGIAMTAIEYIAGKIFIVGMKVKLWDYSDRWGNIEGIICPQFSLYWTLLGAFYLFVIHPYMMSAVSWLFGNLAFSFVIGFFFGVFCIDFACSVKLLTRLRRFAKEQNIVVRLEEFKNNIADRLKQATGKVRFRHFFFAFRGNTNLFDQLKSYREELAARKEKETETPEKTEKQEKN